MVIYTTENFENQPRSIVTNFTSKDTITLGLVDCQLKMLNFELLHLFSSVMNWEQHSHIAITTEM